MSVINSFFLFATGAALLPVLYHLVQRYRAKTVPFPSLMLLGATSKAVVRKRRLKDLLLMAARALLFLLLALAFARPYLPAKQIPFVQERDRESVVILVDRSFSMRSGDAFRRARDAVRDRLAAGGAEDEFAVVAFDDEVRLLSSLDADRAVHEGALNALDVGYRPTDFYPALQRAEDLLREARHERRVVVMVSDFQDAGWTGALENWTLPDGVAFEPVAIGAEDISNAYIQEARLSRQRTEGRAVLQSDARIAAQGGAATEEQTAALVVDDVEVDRQTLPGRPSASLSFQFEAPREEGYYQGVLALNEDGLPVDDRYYFTDRVDGLPRILVVDAPPNAGRRDAFYLRNAFEVGAASRFDFSQADRVEASALRQSDLVVLANRAAVDAAEEGALRRFVEDGGTLVISPGARTTPAALTDLLEGLGVGRVEAIVDAREELGYEVIIGEADLRHPIFRPFAGSGAGAILRPTFRRYARFVPGDRTSVIGRFDSGDVVLAERPVGGGRVLFFASTFSTSWTDLPINEMYVPILYRIAEYGTRDGDEQLVVRIGEAVPLSGRPSEAVEVRDPDGRLYSVTLDEQGGGFFRETEVPGHYAVAGEDETRFFSVNVDPRESDLRRRDEEEVYAAVVAPPAERPRTPEEAVAAAVESEERQQKLWRLLLLAVIALFAGETYLAHRGTGGKQPAKKTARRSRRARAQPPSL